MKLFRRFLFQNYMLQWSKMSLLETIISPAPSLINPHQLQGRTTALSCLYSHITLYLFMYTYIHDGKDV